MAFASERLGRGMFVCQRFSLEGPAGPPRQFAHGLRHERCGNIVARKPRGMLWPNTSGNPWLSKRAAWATRAQNTRRRNALPHTRRWGPDLDGRLDWSPIECPIVGVSPGVPFATRREEC